MRSELSAIGEALLTSAKGGFCLTDLGEKQTDPMWSLVTTYFCGDAPDDA